MAFTAYINNKGQVFYCFEGEEHRIPNYKPSNFKKLPPNPILVQATIMFMHELPMLDCIETAHELNEKLTMDAAYERETKAYQELRKRG